MRSVVLVSALAACATAGGTTETVDPVVPISSAPLSTERLSRPVHGVGRVQAADERVLSFPFGGIASDVRVVPGQRVTRGAVIAVLDASPARAQLEVARQGLVKAERDAARSEALEGASLSQSQRQDALTGLEVARANVDAASFQARRSTILAPADGTILDVWVEDGEVVGAGMPVVGFAPDGGWEIELTLPAGDARLAVPGTAADVTISAIGATLPGRVAERAGGVGPLGGWAVTVALDPSVTDLATGFVATVDLRLDPEDWLSVGLGSLAEVDGDRAAIYAVDPAGIVRRVPVTIAFLVEDRIALSEGPPIGTEIVVSGVPFLTDGARVRSAK